MDWKQIARQKPCELVLSGEDFVDDVEENDGELNQLVYGIKSLNFLDVTDVPALTRISGKISSLSNLTNLILRGNNIEQVPAEIGSLEKLKCLDLSRNKIRSLPDDLFEKLSSLQILNLEHNKLKVLPNMQKLENLITLKFSYNRVEKFPDSLFSGIYKVPRPEGDDSTMLIVSGGAFRLTEIYASNNAIETIPFRIHRLIALKILDLSCNQLKVVPRELAECPKLKDLNLKENPLSDRRLGKMIDQCPSKKVIDYICSNCKSGREQKKNDDDDDDESDETSEESDEEEETHKTIIVQKPENVFKVEVSKTINAQRKIVACILKNVDLSNVKVLKKFIQIQTKLHQGICENRQRATIATHDLSKLLPPPVTFASKTGENSEKVEQTANIRMAYFDGRVPTKIKIVPLGRAAEMTAQEFYRLLKDEADQYRKEKKRNTISGIHKYLNLLSGKQYYPVLLDYSKEHTLSLPPLTNSEYSRINANTKDVFVEVTGTSVPICREVMNEFIKQILDMDVRDEESDEPVHMIEDGETLYIEPVVVQSEGDSQLIVKFPAKIDLQFDDVNVKADN